MVGSISALPFNSDHIFRLTDSTGMFQHAKFSVPDPSKGYTTDDNARALIVAILLWTVYDQKEYLDLAYRYLSFVVNAQTETGKYRNFMSYNRRFLEDEGSEDCFGRCLWALGHVMANPKTPDGMKEACKYLLARSLPNVPALQWLRAKAYAIIGLKHVATTQAYDYIQYLSASLADSYKKHAIKKWCWFEDALTYSNAVLPWAMFIAGKVLEISELLSIAEESLAFLEKVTFTDGYFKPIGCQGWYSKSGIPAKYDEQPLEACETALAYLEGYASIRRIDYLAKAKTCRDWYLGKNSLQKSLIDPQTGGCYDGITPTGVNLNQGAESIISYSMCRLIIDGLACEGK
ncbi:hypothetical protein SCACP_27580 [Sporomusa carbonis]|uniref:glycosyltransferase n=1 Tax=Sporomusa carbonis TaxID=3076075 RepID=UPI003A711FD6